MNLSKIKDSITNGWFSLLTGTIIFLFADTVSSWLVNNIFMPRQIVLYTLYEGYADTPFLLYLCAICFWYLTRKQFRLLPYTLLFTAIAFVISFILHISHYYWMFYVQTDQNGQYTFEDFTRSVSFFFDDYTTLLPNKLGCFFDADFWIILSILLVGIVAKIIIKNKDKKSETR